ncbi:MAG: NAD-dependent epimerase/dehydratase family protein [Nitrospirota bacterium]
MKATLIFPGITNCGWNCFGKTNNSDAVFIPHGLAQIAACARAAGHEIDAIDLRRLTGWDEFENNIKARGAGIFGISSMSVDFGNALETIQRIKKTLPGSIIVLGGVHATVAFDDVVNIKEVDHIIKGEGEISFSQLLDTLEKGGSPERVINGISPDINTLPYPDRELFGFEKGEMNLPWLPHMPSPFVSIIASRGCPHKCAFCQPAERAVFGGKARIRTVESVIDELKYLRERYRFRSLLVHDDYFAFNPAWIERFCDAYRDNGFDQMFTCQVRSDFIVRNEGLVKRMADCGLSCFMIGFESGSQRVLDFIKKGTTVEMNRKAVEICRKYGIRVFANYMMGLPTETPEEVFKTIDFIRWARPDYPSAAFFTPHPGSELYEYCEKHDLSLIKSYKSYARNPTEPKIKGVDYNFLRFAMHRATEYKVDERLDTLHNIQPKNADMEKMEKDLKEHKIQLGNLDKYYREKLLGPREDSGVCSPKIKSSKGKVLITGGTGFIGSALAYRLMEKGYSVTVVTRNTDSAKAKHMASRGARVVQGSVEDSNLVEQIRDIDYLYHFAVYPGTEGKKMFDINIGGTKNMLDLAVERDVKKFVYASSIESQGTTSNSFSPLNEEMQCRPVSQYGLSKLEGENLVSKYIEEGKIRGMSARIGNVYGVGGLSFIHAMSQAVIEKNVLLASLPLMGGRIVQPIYIDDLIRAFVLSLENDDEMNGIYNFTGHQPVTIEEWFRELAVLLGLEKNVDEAVRKEIGSCDIAALKKAHAHINYFMSGDEPDIHRFYTDDKLLGKIENYQTFSLPKGLAYTLEWYYSAGVFNAYIAA